MSLILSAQNNSLLAGKAGNLLFTISNDKNSKKKWTIIEDILTNIGQNINPTYGIGVTGILSTFNLLIKQKIVEGDQFEEVFNLFDSYLDNSCSIYIQQGNTDFLFGASGLIYYFLANPFVSSQTINTHILHLLSNPDVYKEIGFEPNRHFEQINLGIAHGITGTGLVLIRALHDPRVAYKELIRDTIKKIENFILSNLNHYENSFFPIKIDKNTRQKINSETLSWSYGDLGIILFLMEWAIFENDQIKIKTYIQLLHFTLPRLANQEKSDMGLRHGTSGLLLLLNRLLILYPDSKIKDIYTMELTLFTRDIPKDNSTHENFEGLLGAKAIYNESKTETPIGISDLFLM